METIYSTSIVSPTIVWPPQLVAIPDCKAPVTLPCADAAALVLVVFSLIGKPISLCSLFLGAAVPHASHTVQIAETDRLHSEHPLADHPTLQQLLDLLHTSAHRGGKGVKGRSVSLDNMAGCLGGCGIIFAGASGDCILHHDCWFRTSDGLLRPNPWLGNFLLGFPCEVKLEPAALNLSF